MLSNASTGTLSISRILLTWKSICRLAKAPLLNWANHRLAGAYSVAGVPGPAVWSACLPAVGDLRQLAAHQFGQCLRVFLFCLLRARRAQRLQRVCSRFLMSCVGRAPVSWMASGMMLRRKVCSRRLAKVIFAQHLRQQPAAVAGWG